MMIMNCVLKRPLRPSAVCCLVLAAALFQFAPRLAAAAEQPESEAAFSSAVRRFEGGWYDLAEKGFAEFLAGSPQSTNRSEAILLQAQSRFRLKNYEGTAALLESQLKAAGKWADQYLYWLAEAQSEQEHFDTAAKTYARLLKEYPESKLRLQASYGEAYANFKLGAAARTVELLRNMTNAFQLASKTSTNEAVLARGNFLLAEALFAQRDFKSAEQTLTELARRGLSPEFEWQRQFLLTRIAMADRRPNDALVRVTNLVSNARSNALLQARSFTLKAEILESTKPEAAVQAYDDIIKIPGIPPEQSRQALLKLVELSIAQNRLTNAIARLQNDLEQNPQQPASDLLMMTLGEIYLKQFYVSSPLAGKNGDRPVSSLTNLLSARAQFEQVIMQFTNSVYLGKAHLNRGWCFWEEGQVLNDQAKLVEAQKALHVAIRVLPKSVDQATARLKLADCFFQLNDLTNAITNYQAVLDQYADVPEAWQKLFDQTLSQMVRVSIQAGNLPGAEKALGRLLQDFPKSEWADDAMLQFARALADAGDFNRAQQTLLDLEKRFPNSPLLSEAQLARARAFARQSDWAQAIQQYDHWIERHATNDARAQAEFDRAWCYAQSGSDTNAFRLFSNVAQQFPSSSYAAMARLWIGDYYLNAHNFDLAEINYYNLSTNKMGRLTEHAQLMAAKAAFFGQRYTNAFDYLTRLVNDTRVEPDISAEAWFMLGDLELEDSANTNNLAKFAEAIKRFQRVILTTNSLVPLALGKMANCHFQLAAQDTNRYEMATNLYLQVITHPLADAPARNQAEVALGQVLEKMAGTNRVDLLKEALDHYLRVVYSKEPDPFWMGKAAMSAGTLASDRLQLPDQAERLYKDMINALPSMRSVWETRLNTLQRQRTARAQ